LHTNESYPIEKVTILFIFGGSYEIFVITHLELAYAQTKAPLLKLLSHVRGR